MRKNKKIINRVWIAQINIAKRLLRFMGASTILFFINLGSKIFQSEFLFEKTEILKSLLFMFSFSLIFHFLLIIIYDWLKIDFFDIEEIKKYSGKEFKKQKAPWLIGLSTYFGNKIFCFKKLKQYFEKKIWIKKIKKILIFIGLNLGDPIIAVIFYREGSFKWNKIPNLKIFLLFFVSCFACSLSLVLIFSGIYILF